MELEPAALGSVGDGEAFEGSDERASRARWSHVGQWSEGRRRGRLGAEGAVSIQHKVNAGCG